MGPCAALPAGFVGYVCVYRPCTGSKVYLKWRPGGAEQDLIPYVRQLVFSNVPVERWIIDPDVHCLLHGPGDGI